MQCAMFARYTAIREDESRQARAQARHRTHGSANRAGSLPEALPCTQFEERFPKDADVWGNVLIKDEAEFQQLAPMTSPISREEAVERGCCIVYKPAVAAESGKRVEPQYYHLSATDDSVYGRAAYLSTLTSAFVTSSAEKAKNAPAAK